MVEQLERGERLRRRKQRTARQRMDRDTWVAAAIDIVGEHGPNALNIDQLAKRLAISRGSFYSHFDDRHDLALACAEHVLAKDRNEDHRFIPTSPEHARELLEELIEFAYADTQYQRAFFHLSRLDEGPDLDSIIAQVRQLRIGTYTRLLTTLGLDADEAERRGRLMHAAFIGHHSLVTANPDYHADQAYIDTVKTTLIPNR